MGVTKPKPADFRNLARRDRSKPEFSVDWFSQHIGTWSEVLSEFKGKPRIRAIEIGCFEGRATRWLLENILTHSSSKVMAIDTFEGDPLLWKDVAEAVGRTKAHLVRDNLLGRFTRNMEEFKDKVLIRQGVSRHVLTYQYLIGGGPSSFDFAYVDGSHRPSDVLADAVLVWTLIRKGGMVIFDDYKAVWKPGDPRQPRIGIDSFLSAYKGRYEKVSSGYQMIIRKAR